MNDPRNFSENFLNKFEKREMLKKEFRNIFEVDEKYLPIFAESGILFREVCKSLNNEVFAPNIKDDLLIKFAKRLNEIIYYFLIENFIDNFFEKNLNINLTSSFRDYFDNPEKLTNSTANDFYFIKIFLDGIKDSGITSYFNTDKCFGDVVFKKYVLKNLTYEYVFKLFDNYHLNNNNYFTFNSAKDKFFNDTINLVNNIILGAFKINV